MRSAQTLETSFRCRLGRSARVLRAALSGLSLCLMITLGALLNSGAAVAQNSSSPGAFVTGLEDVPLMPDLQDVPEAAVIFDKPAGRLIEAYAEGDVEGAAVMKFYRETLPQLGWSSEAAAGATGVFFREGERLEIHVLEGQDRRTVRFVLSPR